MPESQQPHRRRLGDAEVGEDMRLAKIFDRLRSTLDGFDGVEFNTVGTDRIGFSVKFSDDRGVVAAANSYR